MTSVYSRLNFDWNLYLSVARELVQSNNTAPKEEHYRSAVSRAYYAAFCRSRNYLKYKRGLTLPDDYKVHSFVIDYFKQGRDPNFPARVGNILFSLRSQRNTADYDNYVSNSAALAKLAIKDAQKIIDLIDSLSTNTSSQ